MIAQIKKKKTLPKNINKHPQDLASPMEGVGRRRTFILINNQSHSTVYISFLTIFFRLTTVFIFCALGSLSKSIVT